MLAAARRGIVGRGRAFEIVLGGEDFGGELAERYGYVNRAIPDADFVSFVDAYAQRVSRFDRRTLTDIKGFINAASLPDDVALMAEMRAFAEAISREPAVSLFPAAFAAGWGSGADCPHRSRRCRRVTPRPRSHTLGQASSPDERHNDPHSPIGVIGGGSMGAGIAHVFAAAGCLVTVVEETPAAQLAARERVAGTLARAAEKSKLSEPPDQVLVRVRTAGTPHDLPGDTVLVVEAVPELTPADPEASGQAEAAASGGGEVVGAETVGPAALVVLGGEVGRAGAGQECLAHAGGVALVARAPGRGRDVHDVSPALLVLHGGNAVDHVAVPPDGVAGLDVGDAGQRLEQQRVPAALAGKTWLTVTPHMSSSGTSYSRGRSIR